MSPTVFYIINLAGGGADTACADCLQLALKERGVLGDGSLISTAIISRHGAYCVYCGLEGDE